MQSRSSQSTRSRSDRSTWQGGAWLDIAMLFTWGAVLIKFWVTGQINILLHPDYQWLAHGAAIVLLGLGMLKLLRQLSGRPSSAPAGHISLLPPNVGSTILLITAIVGLIYQPQPFNSTVALERGVTETLSATRAQPQAFGNITQPEDKSLIDWVRTLNVYPEPDAYTGQPANIDGFVVHDPTLPEDYLLLSRFVITCCAADVYPVGLPVKLTGSRDDYPADEWLAVTGTMATAELAGDRRLVVDAAELTAIPAPKNPYEY